MKTWARLATPLLVSALTLTATACGSSTPTAAPGAPGGPTIPGQSGLPGLPGTGSTGIPGVSGSAPDACTAVTADQATTLVGTPVTKLSGTSEGTVSECVYGSTTTTDSVGVVIEQVPGEGSVLDAALQSAIDQHSSSDGTTSQVSGLGDKGIKIVSDHDVTYGFRKGDTLVIIYVTSSTKSGTDLDTGTGSIAQTIAGQI